MARAWSVDLSYPSITQSSEPVGTLPARRRMTRQAGRCRSWTTNVAGGASGAWVVTTVILGFAETAFSDVSVRNRYPCVRPALPARATARAVTRAARAVGSESVPEA